MAVADFTRFQQLVAQNELQPQVADQLFKVLSSCEVVLLCDDSSTMGKAVIEEGADPFAPTRTTRWSELKKLASIVIEFVTAINPNGLDIYFLNRPEIRGVTTPAGLQGVFSLPPNGLTPLIGALRRIYEDKKHIPSDLNLLIVVITDGEPTDGTRADLYNALYYKRSNVHVSFAECTDNAEDMEYLDQWDGRIPFFDNTDDYREELMRVKNAQGPDFKFDYTDYVIKILLATFVKRYFNLDQVKVSPNVPLPSSTRQFPQPQPVRYQAPPPYQPPMLPSNSITVAPAPSQVIISSYRPKKEKDTCSLL